MQLVYVEKESGGRKEICANKLTSKQITDLFLVCEERHTEHPACVMATS